MFATKGFSMLDALMALVIVSCGCIGLLRYQWRTVKSYQYQRNYAYALQCLDELSERQIISGLFAFTEQHFPNSCRQSGLSTELVSSTDQGSIVVHMVPGNGDRPFRIYHKL